MSTVTVDAGQLKKAVRRLGTAAERSAAQAVKVAIAQSSAFYMSFDEAEAVAYDTQGSGRIVVSSSKLENAASIEDVLAAQAQIAATTMNTIVQNGLKEALK